MKWLLSVLLLLVLATVAFAYYLARRGIKHTLTSLNWDVSRGSWKKNGALHSVIRVSDQAATSACSRTSLRRW